MTLTIQDMSRRSMELLGVIGAEEEPAAEDHALFARTYATKWAELTMRDLIYFEAEEIPEEAFEALCQIMADMNASAFGKSPPITIDENGQQVSMKVAGFRDLRRLVQKRPSGLPAHTDYC